MTETVVVDIMGPYARHCAAEALSADLSGLLCVDNARVADALAALTDDLLNHYDTPRGWALLAEYVANDIGIPFPGYSPRVH